MDRNGAVELTPPAPLTPEELLEQLYREKFDILLKDWLLLEYEETVDE
jgi:hypothetical protein